MSESRRGVRAFASLVMGAGIAAVTIGGLDLVRDGLAGPLADFIPNVSLPPLAILAGAAMVAGGAVLRRGKERSAGLPPGSDAHDRALKSD